MKKSKESLMLLIHVMSLLLGIVFVGLSFGFKANLVFWLSNLVLLASVNILFHQFSNNRIMVLLVDSLYIMSLLLIVSVTIFHLQNELYYGEFIAESAKAIFQTNISEMYAYISQYGSEESLYLVLMWLLFVYISYVFVIKHRCKETDKSVVALFSLLGIVGSAGSYVFSQDLRMVLDEAKNYSEVLTKYAESRESLKVDLEKKNITSDYDGNLVLVIGESTSRHHMSLYNYFRKTTPNLDAIKDDLIVYQDVISTHSHTTESLSDVLVFNNRINRGTIYNRPDLISVLKRAGFSTTWLSNQNATGIWDNVVSVASRESDQVIYHTDSYGKEFLRSEFDDVMLGSLKDQLNNNNNRQFVVMHTMAGHFPYCGLIPEDYQNQRSEFSIDIDEAVYGLALRGLDKNKNKEKIKKSYLYSVNCYDSAIKYIDSVVSKVVEEVDQLEKPTLMVYFADHGEAPLLNSGHESRMHSHFHVEVPFVIYANQAYRDRYPDKLAEIKSNIKARASLVDLPYSILDLLEVQGIESTEKRSIVSNTFESFDRTTLHEKIAYDQVGKKSDAIEKTRGGLNSLEAELQSKIWAHRVNSLGKMMQAKDIFSGIELDLVYDGELKVNHPPAKDAGLTLKTFMKMDNGETQYWFDLKNLNNDNETSIVSELNALDTYLNIKDRVFVETENLNAIGQLIDAGWSTSYYLPTDQGVLALKDPSKQLMYIESIKKIVLASGVSAISFDARLMPIFSEHLREFVVENNLKVYIWNQSLNLKNEKHLASIKELLADPVIEVLLVGFSSIFNR